MSENLPANTNQALAIIRGTSQVYEPRFLQIILESSVSHSAHDKARGMGMSNISLGDLRNLVVPLPPMQAQHRIVEIVDSLISKCNQLEEQINLRLSTLNKISDSFLNGILSNGM